ncbi:hypothetical protein F5888DRAFT_1892540 [Russula emetica]|nr:hypothetical protein F5888DRAFT_1892540 [Russula emetica]
MQRHRIFARIILLLILSVINFALAAPVLVRGIREVRVDVMDVAEDVTPASRKRWNPSDKPWTNAADRSDTSPGLDSRDSDNSHPLPVGSPPPAHNNLPLDMDLNATPQPIPGSTDSDNSHPLPVGSPPPAHNNLPLDVDLNAIPQPTLSDNSHPLPVGSPPPADKSLPLDLDLNATPQQSQEPTDGSDSGSHSTGWSTDDYDSTSTSIYNSDLMSSYHPSDAMISPSAWRHGMSVFDFPNSETSTPSYNPNSQPQHGNLNIDLNRPPSSTGSTDDQPPPAPSSDSGSLKRPYSPSDPGPSKRPYSPSDSGPSTWAYPPSDAGSSTPSSPRPLQHESENLFSELFRGRFKRRISGSRSVNAA